MRPEPGSRPVLRMDLPESTIMSHEIRPVRICDASPRHDYPGEDSAIVFVEYHPLILTTAGTPRPTSNRPHWQLWAMHCYIPCCLSK